ncbi:hypothetical protein ABEB36_002252 [Hypothenemus hampei]|uniref:Cytochrome c oxidase assembly factor 3 n=1 Tax=Hypothenemus hampei TaxID=57062 RepID=A0ABD1F532_HYPHA
MSDRMPKVDFSKLKASEREFIQRVSRENAERVAKLQKVKRNNLITAGILGSLVASIYAYTILSIKQETFLDDFEEPAKVTQKTPNKA